MSPPSTELLLSVAHAHHSAGRHAEAEALYQKVLISQPNHGAALNRLGVLLLQTKRAEAAVIRLRKASEADPRSGLVLSNLGAALRETHAFAEAVDTLRDAVRLDPNLAMAHMNLAGALLDDDRPADALVAADTSVSLDPTSADAHNNRGNALKALDRWDEAIDAYRTALSINPKLAASHSNLGVALAHLNDLPAAIAHYRTAITIDPNYAQAFGNLANALAASGDLDSALLAARRGVQLSPGDVKGHWNLAVVLLSRGDYAAGWEEYEWRFRSRGDTSLARYTMPRWKGEDLSGKTILLHAEQGFGDAIQFVRYVPRVAERAAVTVLECHAELKTLFETVSGPAHVIARGDPLPAADFHCPLMSLAWMFGTTLESVPCELPYFRLPPSPGTPGEGWGEGDFERDGWLDDRNHPHPNPLPGYRERGPSKRLKVGVVWAGNPKHSNDARRSLKFSQLAPLLRLDADFVSLQRGSTESLPSGVGDDFLQTARTIAGLDLVIAVDTAVAHLAAALAVPTWIMLPAGPDWRWLTTRTDSPWYPTVRLFRQNVRDHWDDVVDRVSTALAELLC